jgi:hypothetical protein
VAVRVSSEGVPLELASETMRGTACYVGPSWFDTGLASIDIAFACPAGADISTCSFLYDVRTSCSKQSKHA